ncbi:MAG: hypothetical protein RMK64_10145 [Rhodovarius sp.]|nr:hypothetical protein [Rhodovarius sp.]MCX7932239.1 hypothetical protein [Rhodovarius sp.]MDW8315319.1 hypothetical protein [Rhodovarius sp.]
MRIAAILERLRSGRKRGHRPDRPPGGTAPSTRARRHASAAAGAASGLAALLLLALPAAAQVPTAQEFGTWTLGCITDRMTDRTACRLQHKEWVERPGSGPGMALEIQDRGGRLVPVVTARDLGLDGASRGLMALAGRVQIRFDRHPMFEMSCALEGRNLVCFPHPDLGERAERELAEASTVLIRLTGLGAGGGAQAEPIELPLSGTRQAMARLRELVPPSPPRPAEGSELRELLGRLQRLFQ